MSKTDIVGISVGPNTDGTALNVIVRTAGGIARNARIKLEEVGNADTALDIYDRAVERCVLSADYAYRHGGFQK